VVRFFGLPIERLPSAYGYCCVTPYSSLFTLKTQGQYIDKLDFIWYNLLTIIPGLNGGECMKFISREAKKDMKSVEQFSAMRDALAGEQGAQPTRIARLARGVIHIAQTVQDTFREGREADKQLRLEAAEAHLEQGYSTNEDLEALRQAGQPVQIKMPWQQ
jgi:hypothetical protein